MVGSYLEDLNRVLDSLHGADRCELAETEILEAAYRAKNRIDAFVAKVSAVYDDSGEWQACGAKSARAAISTLTHQPLGLTGVMVRHGKKLKQMSYVADAYAAGDI